MKARNYFYALAAMLALAACSNDDLAVDETTTDEDSTGNLYMKVNLSFNGQATTREESSTDYENATSAEVAISKDNSLFLFFDDGGNYLTYGMLTSDLTKSAMTSSSDGVDYSASVVISPCGTPTKVLAIFNYSSVSDLKANISEELAISNTVSALPTSSSSESDRAFTMASAVLWSETNSEFYTLTDVTSNCFYSTLTEANNGTDAATIYVEREVAKVTINVQSANTKNSDDTNYIIGTTSGETTTYSATLSNTDFIFYDGETFWNSSETNSGLSAKVTLSGWGVTATNSTGYVVKNVDSSWASSSSSSTAAYAGSSNKSLWIDSNTQSFFWAKDANYTYSSTDSYTIGLVTTTDGTTTTTGSGTGVFNGLTYQSWASLTSTPTTAVYYHENTADAKAQSTYAVAGAKAAVPCVVVAGNLTITTSSTSGGTTTTKSYGYDSSSSSDIFYSYGYYFSEAGLISIIGKELSDTYQYIESESATTTSDLSSSNISLTYKAVSTSSDNSSKVMVSGVTVSGSGAIYTTSSSAGDSSSTVTIDGTTWYKVADSSTGTSDTSLTALITAINNTSFFTSSTTSNDTTTTTTGVSRYKSGMCYYMAPIRQITYTGTDNTPGYFYGLVRNHSYKITLNSISGIGGPVNDSSEELVVIPGDEDESYLRCSVNILKWVSKSQTINF